MHACSTRGNPFVSRLVIGTGLTVLGLAFIVHNLVTGTAVPALRVWPLVLLLLAAACFIRRGWHAFGGHLLLLGAVALELKQLGHAQLLARWWPLALIWLGVARLACSFRYRRHRHCCQDAPKGLS
jgi:hypothetical protein